MSALQEMQRTLAALIDGCQGDQRPNCPILDELAGTGTACANAAPQKRKNFTKPHEAAMQA